MKLELGIMKLISSCLFLFFMSVFSLDLNEQLNQMEQQQQQEQLKGFVVQKKMELIPPSELFKDAKVEEMKMFEPLQPIPQSVNSTNYVSYQVYHEDILQLSNKVATLEYALDRLTKITSGVQKSSINNSEFILKLVEILAAAIVGGGGLIGTLLAYKKKKV